MRLLFAEDEKALSRAVCEILKKSNYAVDPVYDGQDALDYLENGEYDGAILDVMMPKMDGIQVLKAIRAQGNTIPVLMLTAKSEVDDKVLGLDSGANDYLTKPFAAKELLARIRAMTRQAAPSQVDSVLRSGNLSLNQATLELSGPQGSVKLGGKEYQLMELLMANQGRLIPTERIMEKVWGYETDTDISVIWVYISYLRKKLASLGADVAIRATRGVGYSLEAMA